MSLREMIDESVLADAAEADRFLADNGASMPSVEETLRLIRDIDPEVFRTIGENKWGTGGSDGAAMFTTRTETCVDKLAEASNAASAWSGDAKNAFTQRISYIQDGIRSMEEPAEDIGKSLQDIADAFDVTFTDVFNNVLSIIGLAVTVIGLIVSVIGWICSGTGVGVVVGIVAGVISLLAGIGTIWLTMHSVAEEKSTALSEGSTAAQETMQQANNALSY